MIKSLKYIWDIFFSSNSRLYKGLIIFSLMISVILLFIVCSNVGKELEAYTTISLTLFSFTVTNGISNIYEFLSIHYFIDELQDKVEKRKLVFIGSLQNIILISDFLMVLFLPIHILQQITFIFISFLITFFILMWINRDEKVYSFNENTLNIKSEIEKSIAKHQINDDYTINIYQNKNNIVTKIQSDKVTINILLKKAK